MAAVAVALAVGVSATGAQAANRGPITSGQTVGGSFTAGSNDVWSFSYTAGQVVALKGAPPSPLTDRVQLVVRDAGGITRKTIACTPQGGNPVVMEQFTLPASGTYTVTATSCNTTYAGAYNLSFLNATAGPLRASGDAAAEGGGIGSAQTVQGTLANSDIDAFQFRAEAGERLVVYASAAAAGGPGPRMWLYPPPTDPNPTTTLITDNLDRQEISLTSSGTYTLLVLGQALNETGNYYVTLQRLPGASADCYSALPDPDGGVIAAAPTATVSGSIVRRTDLDPWQFHATAGQTATITLSREMRLSLYAPQATRGYGAPAFAYLCGTALTSHAVVLPATGYYELLVEDCATSASLGYTIDLTLPAETAAPPLAGAGPGECSAVANAFDPDALAWDILPAATGYDVSFQEWPLGPIELAGTVPQPAGARAVFPIPYRDLPTGTVYSWHVDATDGVTHTFSPTYSFGLLCSPTLSVTPVAAAFGDVIVGQAAAPITVTIANTGTCYEDPRVQSVPDGFTVGADTCSGAPAGGHLAPGESCSFQVNFTPDALGPFAGGLVIDGLLPEAHDGTLELSGRGVQPDLRVASVVDPAPPVNGVYVAVTDTTENAGDGPAPGSDLTFLFSLDTSVDAGDIAPVSGSRATPPLAPAAVSTATTNLYLPGTIPSGAWHVGVCADSAGLVTESDETNNCTFSAGTFQVGRDISIAEVTDAPVLNPDGTFSFTETTRNLGTLALPATVTGYWLSLDQKVTRLDLALAATRAVPALTAYPDAAHVSTATRTLAVPADTPRGSYYVAACADATGVVAETSETNNCRLSKSPIRIEPDLSVTALSEPPGGFTGYAGATFSVTDTTVNTGVNAAPASTTSYRLSLDTAITSTDPLLAGSRAVPALGVGGSSTGTVTVTIAATMPAGEFYLAACADDARTIPEGNEGNNCRVSTTRVTINRADLVVTAVSDPPANGAAGTSFSVTDTTGNIGAAASLASVTNYRLSLDGNITASDPQLTGTRAVPVIAAAGSVTGSATVTVPATIKPGSYVLAACGDGTSKVSESNETNNCAVSSGRIAIAAPDLGVTAVSEPPAAGSVGASFSVTDTTANLSATVGAIASTTRYRLSLDRTATSTDPLLTGTRAVPALAGGANQQGTVTVTIPGSVAAGTYYLAACADDPQSVAESSELNNCAVSTGTMTMQRADLTVTAVSNPPASGFVRDTFLVDDTVANGGAVAAGASSTRFYLSLDATIGGSDPQLTGARAVPVLAVGASSAGTGTTVTVPDTVAPGSYYLGACADGASAVAESSEANNCSASATRIAIAKPDLAVTSVSEPPLEIDPGLSFEVTDATVNLGTVPAAASATRYRLSLDQTITTSDPLLTGSRALPVLPAGASSTGTVTLTLPLSLPQASYYLGACADDAAAVPESDETNNCAVSVGTLDVINADLQVSAVADPPAEGFTGTVFDATDTTRNAGAAPTTGPTVTRYRLSADATITSADTLLAEAVATVQHTIAALAPGGTSTATISVTIPAAVPQGIYYLGACADAAGAVTESNEGNNCRASAGTIHVKKPDLQVTALSDPPAEGFVGSSFPVTDTTTNAGLAAAGASTTRYRLSPDATITSTDPLLTGTRAAGALAVGAASTGTVSLTVPATIAQGVYYLAACADDPAQVSESVENNNCRLSAATLSLKKPDLVVTAVTNPPAIGTVGMTFDATDTTVNAGIAAAGASTTRYRLSLDTNVTTADPQLTGSRAVGSLAAGAASTGTVSLTVPGTIAQGVYYLAACADGASAVSESLENNNCRVSTTTIDVSKADLQVTAISNPPSGGTVGAAFIVTETTTNAGAVTAAATVTQYYLSLDRTITASDPLLTGTRAVALLGVGASSADSVTVTIPGTVPHGVYYLGACADATSLVSETNEENNCLASTTTIDLLKADLLATAVSDPPAEGTVGAAIVLSDTTRNDGAAPSVASTTRFRLSTDQTITAADALLTEVGPRHAVPVLGGGETSTASVTATIPAVAQGLYYVGACADDEGVVSEAAENNNCIASAGRIWVRKPDLTVTAVSDPPAEGFVGASFSVTDTVVNGGIADAGAFATRYRLSADTTVTLSDTLLTGVRAVGGLAVGASSSGTATVTIPATIGQGVYYLAACADDANVVSESEEANNCRLAATVISLKKPDLWVTAVSNPPADVTAGTTFSVTDTTENRSGALAPAGASITRYRLSVDATITSADPQFTTARDVAPLAIGASSTGSVILAVPATIAAGTYYFGACADASSTVSESDETNNCLAAAGQVLVRKPDLSATAVSEPPAGGIVGGSFPVTDTTENLATALAPAAATTTRYYLSADRTITTSDAQLSGTRAVPALAVGEASTAAVTVTIPASVAEGAFYLGACADGAAAVPESNENNNCIVSVNRIQIGKSDLRVSAVSDPPAEGVTGDSFPVTDTTFNAATALAAAPASATSYRLSSDETITVADALLTGSRAVASLAIGAASTGTVTVTIPAGLAQGSYYLGACADDAGAVPESSDANNCLASAGRILIKRPDLRATAVGEPPASLRVSETFTVADTVTNEGLAAAGGSSTTFYLSLDAVYQTSDRQLTGNRTVPGLAIGASSAGTGTSVTVPWVTDGVQYHLIACADGTSAVPESDDADNCVASTGTVTVLPALPDLTVTALNNPPTNIDAGAILTIIDTTRNNAAYAAVGVATTTRLYFTLDTAIGPEDTLLASRTVPALAAATNSGWTTLITINANVPAGGPFYLAACADADNAVTEASETNNCRFSTGRVTVRRPDTDLVVTTLGDPVAQVFSPAFSFPVMLNTVTNNGTVASSPSTTRFLWSTDTVIDAGDYLLTGSQAVGSLAAGTSFSTYELWLTTSTDVPDGEYYFAACADYPGAVPETIETNNCAFLGYTESVRRADLQVSSISGFPATVNADASFSVTDTVVNTAPASAAELFQNAYYLSTDAVLDAGDTLLTGQRTSGETHTSATGTATVGVPAGVVPGNYFVAVCTDSANRVPEVSETNNCLVSATEIQVLSPAADLQVTVLWSPPPTVNVNSPFNVTDTTRNVATVVAAAATSTSYYMSRDGVLDGTNDYLLATRAVPALAPGATSTATFAVTIPPTVPGALYQLIACADHLGEVAEAAETNNCRAAGGFFTLTSLADLVNSFEDVVIQAVLPYSPGMTFPVENRTTNMGNTFAIGTVTRFRFSTDTTIAAPDPLLTGMIWVPALLRGEVDLGSTTLTVPAIPEGYYYLGACSDDNNAVTPEVTEANNCSYYPTLLAVRWAALAETAIDSYPTTVTRGTGFSVTDTVTNTAFEGTASAFSIGYRLSSDATITLGDIPITGSRAITGLGPGEASTGTATVTVPGGTAPGTYYLGVCADPAGAVPEEETNDNCRATATTIQVQ